MRDIILALATAPDSQIDASITPKLKALADNPTADGMKAILDECAYAALASDFAMGAMDIVWRALKDEQH